MFTLFLVLDPLGNLPVVMAMLKDTPVHRRRWGILRESLVALAVLVAFLLGGSLILGLMGMLLIVIAVHLLMAGIAPYLKG